MSVFKFNIDVKPFPSFLSLSFVTGITPMESVRITPFQRKKGLISEPYAGHGKGCFPKQDLPTHPPQAGTSQAVRSLSPRRAVLSWGRRLPVCCPYAACLCRAGGACRQHRFLPPHSCSSSALHVILGVMGGRKKTSPPSLFAVSPRIHACFKNTMNMFSGSDSVAGL